MSNVLNELELLIITATRSCLRVVLLTDRMGAVAGHEVVPAEARHTRPEALARPLFKRVGEAITLATMRI